VTTEGNQTPFQDNDDDARYFIFWKPKDLELPPIQIHKTHTNSPTQITFDLEDKVSNTSITIFENNDVNSNNGDIESPQTLSSTTSLCHSTQKCKSTWRFQQQHNLQVMDAELANDSPQTLKEVMIGVSGDHWQNAT